MSFEDEPPVEPARGSWRWLFADVAGVAVPGPSVCFTSEDVAENWLTSNAGRLRGVGIAAVTLLDGEHVVYGPTSLPGTDRRLRGSQV